MPESPVFIALSSFGVPAVQEAGQEHFIPLCAQAGAAGVEIRRELLGSPPLPLKALRQASARHGLRVVYSAPFELFDLHAAPKLDELRELLAEAETLGAEILKVSLGFFKAPGDLADLGRVLAPVRPRLLIENDQTPQGGNRATLVAFMAAAERVGIATGLTFDVGNWCWTGADPADAAALLAPHVRYIHCKAVSIQGDRLVAVPPVAADASTWRVMFARFVPGLPRAIEFPLISEDLLSVTERAVHQLALL